MRKSSLILAALAAGMMPAAEAWAQSNPATWVNRILIEWDDIQRKEGWVPQGEIRPGRLASGAEARLDYPLLEGTSYRFVVVCEPGCGAGEAELLAPAGTRVGDPKPLVEMPKLEAAPAEAGGYTLRVAMTDCATETCAWSARVYVKQPAKADRKRPAKSDK
jgi:hypothetical protein